MNKEGQGTGAQLQEFPAGGTVRAMPVPVWKPRAPRQPLCKDTVPARRAPARPHLHLVLGLSLRETLINQVISTGSNGKEWDFQLNKLGMFTQKREDLEELTAFLTGCQME